MSENSWLDRTIPKEAQLSILLVFKVALLIFFTTMLSSLTIHWTRRKTCHMCQY